MADVPSPRSRSTGDLQHFADRLDPCNPGTLGLRWIVEITNTWWSNYGQLRRNTARRNHHRHAALCLATTVLTIGRLIAYRDRWNPNPTPTR